MPTPRPLRTLTLSGAAIALAAGFLAPGPATADTQRPEFYTTPTTLPEHNGDLVRSEPSTFYLDPVKTVQVDADVHRVMYRSADADGDPVAVTGTVLTPRTEWKGDGPRPLIGYAVGTQGLDDQCAPSRQLAAGTEYEGLFLRGLLARGYAVALTDYEGLGTAGVHTYVVRAAQAHAVLDAVRAAQRLGVDEVPSDGPVALAGYSQGGGASAAAAELAPTYAPELDLRGAYAGAVPADLQAVADNIDGGLYTGFEVYAVNGIAEAYDIDLGDYTTQEGQRRVKQARDQCVAETIATYAFQDTGNYTKSGKKLSVLTREEPLRSLVAEQRIGNGRAPRVPVLVGQSRLDDVIPYGQAEALAQRWCSEGTKVWFRRSGAPTHVGAAVALFPTAFAYLEHRFDGDRPRSNCTTL